MQIEAVENHMPEVVIVDEVGTEAEALACRSIAERGVQLVATAHGRILENIIKNPTLCDLVGGVQSVTLGRPFHPSLRLALLSCLLSRMSKAITRQNAADVRDLRGCSMQLAL